MTTLNIEGRKVRVDDSFLSMPPEEQNAVVEEIARSLSAQSPRRQPSPVDDLAYGEVPPGMVLNPRTGQMEDLRSPVHQGIPQGRANALALGAGQGAGFSLMDEAVAGASALTGGDYDYDLARMREAERRAQDEHPGYYYGGLIGGGVTQGAGLASGGLSLGANAAKAGAPLLNVAGRSAVDGLALGAAHGFGAGEDLTSRATGGLIGGVAGGTLGFAAPYAVAGVQAAAKPLINPIMSRMRTGPFANQAIGEGMKRSGMTADDIADALARSQADDQGMFNVADSMGHSGQRMLSTVVRNPNSMRQTVVDTLTDRQMGQGDRLVRALSEGFAAPDTAAQRHASLAATRDATAKVNYAAARQGAGAVNLNSTIGNIDALMKRNPILGESALTKTEIGSRLARLRSQMAAKGEQLVDFDTVLNLKQDLGAAMENLRKAGKSVPHELSAVYGELDLALEGASKGYRLANDTFRAQSGTIDAVDLGTSATSGRTRAADNIPRFQGMTPDDQSAFRSGYADPMIARVEASSVSPTTNRARPLMTEKTGQEFPAFAAPGKGDQLGRRIAREQRMFETANTALGGSKTADNLADAAEMSKFDPGVMMNLFSGRPVAAAVDAVAKLANEAKGMPPTVMDRIAKTLLETNPDVARQMLKNAGSRAAQLDGRRALANAILLNMSASASGRFAADAFRPGPLEITVRP